MNRVQVRTLDVSEYPLARDVANASIDFHGRYVVDRLPEFLEISRALDPDYEFAERQRLVVGAFVDELMIGTVAVERTNSEPLSELAPEAQARFLERFDEHVINVYDTLQRSLTKTIIGSPAGALTIHSLGVSESYRRHGIARSLILHAINALDTSELITLYIEFARIKWLCQFGTSLGFAKVKQTFSISERLEYGCWGSVLMRYRNSD